MKIVQLERIVYTKSLRWKEIFDNQKPLVVEQLAENWPAVSDSHRKWSNVRELQKRIHSEQTVRIEIGKNYMDPKIKVDMISIGKFFSLIRQENPVAEKPFYLAQYELRNIPQMYEDIHIPELCRTGKGHHYHTNIWFGCPQGNISPCHYDPFHNLLVQVVGMKSVQLIDPKYSSHLYPAIGTVQRNTSLVDFENPNLHKFPLFEQVEQFHGQIMPGDAVFIPYKWWHYCKSNELSCSVNFWWL